MHTAATAVRADPAAPPARGARSLDDVRASILLVEDQDGIAVPLVRALAREGYAVERTATGAGALDRLLSSPPDLVILDLGLPDIDGLDVARQARDAGVVAPIIILTARGDELDLVVGLDAGCDDYIAKPFALAELQARIRALLRRVPPAPARAPGTGGVRVDEAARRAWVGDAELRLSAKEYGVLALLARTPGEVVTRERFMDEVWDEHWYGSTKTLDVTLGRLRSKLAQAGAQARVVAVRGVGFRLDEDDTGADPPGGEHDGG